MKLKIIVPLVLLAIVGFTTEKLAVAAWQTNPGAACDSYYGSETSGYYTYNHTGFIKSTTGNGWVVCPIQRTLNVRSTVYVFVYHPDNRTTTCYINRAQYFTGARTFRAGSTTGTSNRTIALSASTTFLGTPTVYDPYSITCYIGQNTIVRGSSWWDA